MLCIQLNITILKSIKNILNNCSFIQFSYILYSIFYASYIFYNPLVYLYGLDIPQDIFLGTDGNLKLAMDIRSGRFYPLANMQYIALLEYLSAPVYFCFLYRSFLFILCSFLYYKIGNQYKDPNYVLISFVVITISPTFLNNWLEPFTSEVELSAIFLIFAYYLNKKQHQLNYINISVLIIIINIAIYLKEPVFICFYTTALLYFIFDRNKTKNKNILFLLIVLSCILYTIIYYFLIYKQFNLLGFQRYGESSKNLYILNLIKNIVNYSINDGIVIITILVLIVYKLKNGFFKFIFPDDILLILGFTYLASFLILNMYSLNYLLPIYFIIAIRLLKINLSRPIIILVFALYIINAIPLSLNQISNRWYSVVNYKSSSDFVADFLKNNNDKNFRIFFDGLPRLPQYREFSEKYDRGIELNLANHLLDKGIFNFDICSDLPVEVNFNNNGYPSYPISFYSKYDADAIRPGDLFIVSPHSKNAINNSYLDAISKNFTLLFVTNSEFAFPNFSAKNLLKGILISRNINFFMKDKNTDRLPEYYIFLAN